jgi:hypothetical protein
MTTRLLGPGKLLARSASCAEASLCVALSPTRGELVRVSVEDLRVADAAVGPPHGLFAPPYRAEGLVNQARVAHLADALRAVLGAASVPVALTTSDLVLQVSLPLADGPLELELREDQGAPPVPLALAVIEDFAVQVVALPETRVAQLAGPTKARRRTSGTWLRLLAIIATIGAGGYLVGDYLQRVFGCALP